MSGLGKPVTETILIGAPALGGLAQSPDVLFRPAVAPLDFSNNPVHAHPVGAEYPQINLNLYAQVNVVVQSAVVNQIFPQASAATEAASAPRLYPDAMYVAIPDLMKGISLVVGLLSAFSLLLTALSGYVMIDPLIAVLFVVGAAGFYLMGIMISSAGGAGVKTGTAISKRGS